MKSIVEYADYDIPIYSIGECRYTCKYCFLNVRQMRKYTRWLKRIDVEKTLARAERLARRGVRIIVSYFTEPYPPQEVHECRTRRLLSILVNGRPYRPRILVLTRNPELALRDADIMWRGGVWLGTTVTCIPNTDIEREECEILEEGAPSSMDRLDALAKAKSMDIHTWLNIEPVHVLTDLEYIIELTSSYVDAYVISPLRYHEELGLEYLRPDNYGEAARRAARQLEELGKPYIIRGLDPPVSTWVV